MKTFQYLVLTLVFISFSASAYAQVGSIEMATVEYDKQNVDALMVSMKPERKDVQKAFDDWINDRYDINMKGGGLFSDKNTRMAEAVSIPAVSSDNINLMTMTEETGRETKMYLFASRGLSNFIERNEREAFDGMERVFDSFLSSYLPEYYEERVAEAEEELEDLRKDLEKNQDDIKKNEKEIRDLREENEELAQEADELRDKIRDSEKMLNDRRSTRRKISRDLGKNRR